MDIDRGNDMSESKSISGAIAAGLDEIHDSWGWFVALGIALIILGAVCILARQRQRWLRCWRSAGCCSWELCSR